VVYRFMCTLYIFGRPGESRLDLAAWGRRPAGRAAVCPHIEPPAAPPPRPPAARLAAGGRRGRDRSGAPGGRFDTVREAGRRPSTG